MSVESTDRQACEADSQPRKLAFRQMGTVLSNLLLANLFVLFAVAHLQAFLAQPRASLLLVVAMESLAAVMLVIRRSPDRTEHSVKTWLATSIGTFAPLMLRPGSLESDLLGGQAIQLAGLGLQLAALLSLNRSFGLLPAHRELKSDGLYRWVRHPLYSAYLVSSLGYLVNNPSVHNALVIAVGLAFQIVRILQEEQLLSEYAGYAGYARTTRWRLIPAVW